MSSLMDCLLGEGLVNYSFYHLNLSRQKAKYALWFAETYELTPQSLIMCDRDGNSHEVEITDKQPQQAKGNSIKNKCSLS